jgi:hypothetical protein
MRSGNKFILFVAVMALNLFLGICSAMAQDQSATDPESASEAQSVSEKATSATRAVESTVVPESSRQEQGASHPGRPVVVLEPISVEESLKMRDPFRKPAKFAAPGNDLALPDLERYGTDQIKIVGIITGPKKPKALVVTPNNKMFIVSENDRMGIHKGVVTKIGEKSIVVRERIVNLVGQEENTDTEIFYTTKKSGTDAGAASTTTQ